MSNVEYKIAKLELRGSPIEETTINKDRYNNILKSKECLIECIAIEEKFWFILQSYRDFELQILSETVDQALFDPYFRKNNEPLYKITHRLFNLLSATRLYIDHLGVSFNKIYEIDSSAWNEINEHRKNLHHNSLSYQLMEKLRNFLQHRSISIGLLVGGSWVEDNNIRYRRHYMVPYLDLETLDSRDIKEGLSNKLFNKLKNTYPNEEKIYLKQHADEYIECLHDIHMKSREVLFTQKEKSVSILKTAAEELEKSNNFSTTWFSLTAKKEDKKVPFETNNISLDTIQRLDEITSRISDKLWLQNRTASTVVTK